MRKTLSILILILIMGAINSSLCFAEDPTAEEILQRVAENMNLVEDMKAKAIYNGSFQGNPYPPNEERLFWVKKPDKSKSVSLKTGYTEIANGDLLYRVDTSTQTINLAVYGVSPSQLDYYYHLAEFKSNHTLTLVNTEVIATDNIYTIEAIPNTANELYVKIILKINYNKGLVLKRELYDATNYKTSTEEILSYQLFTLGTDATYQATKIRQTIHFDDGEIISEVAYQDIELNTGLDDSLFQIPSE